jgi:hypothetical protein
MKIGPLAVAALLCLPYGFLWAAAERPGIVRGIVVDDSGAPVAAVQVSIDLSDGLPKVAPVRMTETDKNGHFLIGNLEFGSYKVFAMKEAAGYPNTSFAFYSNQIFATATLTAKEPAVDLILKVGPMAGITTGLVTDEKNIPINATFLLRRASDPDSWISMSQRPEYRILVPPKTDVLLEVSAPGYKTWYYGGAYDLMKRGPIRLESREEMKLDVQLQPEDKPEKRP